MRRTVTDAQRSLEDALPRLSDYLANQARGLLSIEETKAKQAASVFVEEREEEALQTRAEALKQLTAARDGLDDLAAEGALGRLSAHDYTARMDALTEQQRDAEQALAQANTTADQMAEIEAAPLEWFSSLQARLPSMMSEVPW